MYMQPDREFAAVRLDKWLWAARFFKTRTLAIEAVNGGHVKINGNRGKPSQRLHIGDELVIRKGGLVFKIRVTGLSDRRRSAALAQQLYEEDESSIRQRQDFIARRKLEAMRNPTPARKPDKRQRRQIIRFVNKYKQDVS